MKTTDIYSHEWCELVFEGRNHAYGAYELREHTAKRKITAVFLAASLLVMIAASPMILHHENILDSNDINSGIVDLTKPSIDKPKDIVDPIVEPAKEKPVLVSTIAYLPTEIAPDVLASEVSNITQDILNIDTRRIGPSNFEGGVTGPISGEWGESGTGTTVKALDTTTYIDVSQMPAYLGGEEDLFTYLRSSIKYPALARELNITGIVYVTFTVNRDGNLKDIKVLRGIGGGCDEEAVRVISKMPRWNPGKQNGNPVNVRLNIPINFVLK